MTSAVLFMPSNVTNWPLDAYYPVVPFLTFPLGPDSPCPGARHRSIAAARKAGDTNGTRSILDMETVDNTPGFGVLTPLSPKIMFAWYGNDRPTRSMVEATMDFLEGVKRGQGVYMVIYKEGEPHELCLTGYSYD